MVCASYSDRKILIAAFVASPDILLRNVMASSQNSIPNSSQVNLDIFGSDIDKHNLKSTVPSVQHHLQVILSCERCLHRETLGVLQVLCGRLEHLASGCNGKHCGHCGREGISDSIGIEEWNFSEEFRVPAGQCGLAGTVCSGNEGRITAMTEQTAF